MVLPAGGIVAAVEHDGNLEDLNGVHEDGCDDQSPVLFGIAAPLVAQSQQDRQHDHGQDQARDENEMLGGEVSFRLTGIAANAEKFFHGRDSFHSGKGRERDDRTRPKSTISNNPIVAQAGIFGAKKPKT